MMLLLPTARHIFVTSCRVASGSGGKVPVATEAENGSLSCIANSHSPPCFLLCDMTLAEHTPDQAYDPLSFHNTVLMAVYENQRAAGSFPLSFMAPKFSANALTQQDIGGPWSLPNGRPSTKDDVHLPLVPSHGQSSTRTNMQRGWFWLTEWVIDLGDPNVDGEGWQYGKSFTDSNQLWTSTAPTSGGNWVRRRKWIRVMKKRMDMITPSEQDAFSSDQMQELAGNYMKRANLALRPDEPFSDRHQELGRYRQAIQILLRGIKGEHRVNWCQLSTCCLASNTLPLAFIQFS